MKLNKIVGVFLLVLLVLFVSACSRQAETAAGQQASGAEEVSSSLNEAMDSADSEFAEMDKLSQDLSTEELDVLDAELSEVETAELS